MFEVGDKVEVKRGKFQGCVGTVIDIDHCSLPPITIRPDDIRKFQGVFFYECDLKKIELTLDELENKWSELYRKKRELQKEVDRITAEMNKILYEINNLPLDNSENL